MVSFACLMGDDIMDSIMSLYLGGREGCQGVLNTLVKLANNEYEASACYGFI